jgi:hypothetical protein
MLQDLSQRLDGIPVAGVVALGVMALVQIALQVYALIDLARRTRVTGAPKWLWVIIIVLGQVLGCVIYLVIGRKPHGIVEVPIPAGATHDRVQRVLNSLYGRKDPP